MPDRQDEFWASQKENYLKYCYKHKHFYRPEFGCQLCYIEQSTSQEKLESTPEKIELIKCPQCLNMSLAWFAKLDRYECMYEKCQNKYTKQQYEKDIKLVNDALAEPQGKAWFGNLYFDPKKKKWRKGY
jgi:hypothetical protein